MNKSKIIIVEAPQGGWKTTVTNNLRNDLTCSNLLRLSGGKGIDSNIPIFKYYIDLIDFIRKSHNVGMNFILDRFYFSEQVYCRMGLKDYGFDYESTILNHKLKNLETLYDLYFILLVANEDSYKQRLNRNKPVYEKAVFSSKSSMEQQKHYLDIFESIDIKNKLKIDTSFTTSKNVTQLILNYVNN